MLQKAPLASVGAGGGWGMIMLCRRTLPKLLLGKRRLHEHGCL